MTQANPDRLDRIEATLETVVLAIRQLSERQNEFAERQEQTQRTVDAIASQQAINADQIAQNTAGLVQLRNIVADLIRSQQR